MKIETLVILGILGLAVYRAVVWLMEGKRTPDPWGPEIQNAIDNPEAAPLCHHCLTPQTHDGWFCPECGSMVGRYGNYLPNVYIFSVGEAFRRGITERIRWNGLVVAGYILATLCFLSIFAPVCWFFLFRNHGRNVAGEQPTAM